MLKITDQEFNLLAAFIKKQCGIHLSSGKKALLTGRLNAILVSMGMSSYMDYYKYLIQSEDTTALSQLIDRITTNHTYFMRESDHFHYFHNTVLSYLKKIAIDRDLRIWCAASSTGEEPYTLAIIINEFLKDEWLQWDKKILATDISLNVLRAAEIGIYESYKVEKLPKLWLLNYFEQVAHDQYKIKQKLKEQVIFRRFNLQESVYPFKKKLHTIFCRNVMIYFDKETKERLIHKFYDCLEYGGYLFIGHSESIEKDTSPFVYIQPAVYRKL